MSGLSTYTQNAILNWLKGTAMPAAPAAVYVGLFNGDPTDSGSAGVEVTTAVRAAGRLAVPFGAITSNTSVANSAEILFGASATATNVTHLALFSAASGGTLLGSGSVAAPGPVPLGAEVKFPVGALTFSVD